MAPVPKKFKKKSKARHFDSLRHLRHLRGLRRLPERAFSARLSNQRRIYGLYVGNRNGMSLASICFQI